MRDGYLSEEEVAKLLGHDEIPPKIRFYAVGEAEQEFLRSFLNCQIDQYPDLQIIQKKEITEVEAEKISKIYNEFIMKEAELPQDKIFYQVCCEMIQCKINHIPFLIDDLLDKYEYHKYPSSIRLKNQAENQHL